MENQESNQQFEQQPDRWPSVSPVPTTPGKRIWYLWGALIIKVIISYVVTICGEIAYMAIYAYENPEAFMEISTSQDKIVEFAMQIIEALLPYTTLLEGVAALITLPILWVMFHADRKKERRLQITQPVKASLGKYVAILFLSIAMCIGVNNLLYMSGLTVMDESYNEATTAMYSADFGLQILCLGILIPIVEELVFRGLMFKRLNYSMSFMHAASYSALAFGIFHGNLVQMIYAIVLGMLFAYLYEKYGSIKAPICAHIVMNLVSVIATNTGLMSWMSDEYVRMGIITVVCAAAASSMFVLVQRIDNMAGME